MRERYILVAEIDTVISAGVWNICHKERQESMTDTTRNDKGVQGRMELMV